MSTARGARLRPDRGRAPTGQGIVATPKQAAELRAKGFTVTAPYGEAKAAKAAPPDPFATNPTHGYDVFRPWHLQPAPCPGTCSGAVDSAGKPINLQTWYEHQRAAQPGHRQEGRLRQVALRPGPGRLQGQPERAHAVRRRQARRLVRVHPARARVDRDRDRPAPVRLRARQPRPTTRPTSRRCCATRRCGSCRSSTPTATTGRSSSKNTRLWRSNLRDNDDDNVLTASDGVDTNRNWAEKWRYDQEGAADDFDERHLPRPVGRSPSPR